MATQWGVVYAQIADVLLEGNPGLSLGLLTDQQFYSIAAEVLLDFTYKTGLIKRLHSVQAQFGVQVYPQSPTVGDVQAANYNDIHLYESSDFYLSNQDREFSAFANIGNPATFNQDSLPLKTIRISPSPQTAGNDVIVAGGGGGYGTIAGSLGGDFTFAADPSTPAGYGTAAGFNGNPYIEAVNPGYGLIGAMVPSTNNVTMLATALPFQVSGLTAQTYIELVPDSFVPYLKFGILQRVFNGDNELKDEQKAAYCAARYAEGVNLVAAIVCDSFQEDPQQQIQ